MPADVDGPASPLFSPLTLAPQGRLPSLRRGMVSDKMRQTLAEHAPSGDCVCWGIPFRVGPPVVLATKPVALACEPATARWLVFMHTAEMPTERYDEHGFPLNHAGRAQAGEQAAEYAIRYADGTAAKIPIRLRRELGTWWQPWGEDPFEAVCHHKPHPQRAHHEQMTPGWGSSQTRVVGVWGRWLNWLWAWENPCPRKRIVGLQLAPVSGVTLLFAVSAGRTHSIPLRWETRRKAVLTLPRGQAFEPDLDSAGTLAQIALDLGQVISAQPRPQYPQATWEQTPNNWVPEISEREVLVEYTAHPEACFHLRGGRVVPVARLEGRGQAGPLTRVKPATQRVALRVVEQGSARPVPVKLHVHGEAGEYLAPLNRHRQPNAAWFEDYSTDFVHAGRHYCTYIPGETRMDLPLGRVYLEVAKGFEIRPQRLVWEVTAHTKEIVVTLERVLPWRERGWVTADTHVHFLSPPTGLLEGEAEGVNVVNLLASQWGELMTNVGDFDGKTTWGSREAGGSGEYLLRVGTENRQHILGHISLLGYEGDPIMPMTTSGADESALGDPVEVLLTEWARRCKAQNGVVILPHYGNPRAESAAALVEGEVDGVEMASWGNLYGGLNPYSVVDWYRFLNCGYLTAAVGGTDKMSANTAVGTVRTYARLAPGQPFTYETWKQAIRAARTFCTFGPLLEFAVAGQGPGSRMKLGRGGGTLDVTWEAASVTVPMSRVELVVNGEIRESQQVGPERAEGHWAVTVDKSSWLALLIRGHYPGKPEMLAAHSSPVMVEVAGSHFLAAADALSILNQIEGALAYLDTIGTRAQDAAYKRMRLVLTGAHRTLHNRMHQAGHYHEHTAPKDHPEHH